MSCQRMQNGGCLDDGDGANNQNSCPTAPFQGADFQYLAANVEVRRHQPARSCRPTRSRTSGRQDRLHRHDARRTRRRSSRASGVAGLEFTDEVATANALVPVLKAQGVNAIVVLIHQGGSPTRRPSSGRRQALPAEPATTTRAPRRHLRAADSPIIPIAKSLDPAIDMVVSGHTHQPYVCDIPDPAGTVPPGDLGVVVRPAVHRHRPDLRPAHPGHRPRRLGRRGQHDRHPQRAEGRGADRAHHRVQGARRGRSPARSSVSIASATSTRDRANAGRRVRRSATSSPTPSWPTRRSSPAARSRSSRS